MTNYLINLSGNICEILIILFFFKGRYKPSVKPVIFVPCCVLFVLLQFVNNSLFLGKSLAVMIVSVVLIFMTTILYDTKWYYRLVFTVIIFLIIAFAEYLMGAMILFFVDADISEQYENPAIFLLCTLLSKFLAWFFILITKKQTYHFTEKSLNKYLILTLSLPFASALIYVLFLRVYYQINDSFFTNVMLITSLILIFANISIFEIIGKQNRIIEMEEKTDYYEMYVKSQREHYEALYRHENEISGFKHDIKNRLLSIVGIIESGESEKAVYELRNNLDILDEKKKDTVNSGNHIIDAVLQAKLRDAKKNGIMMDIDIKLGEKILIDPVQLGIVLGCAVDNAVEGAAKVPNGREKRVSLNVSTITGRLLIECKNTVAEDFDTARMSTTKSDKRNHGYGMRNISHITERYDGSAIFMCENRAFSLSLSLENKVKEQ